ncbi:MAG: leucine--tRNA ligase [candidate division WOR-3 bacterium]
MERDLKSIQEKWNRRWKELSLEKFKNDPNKKKYYLLEMFAYPSGDLHMGHLRNYVIGDVLYRYRIMNGYDVLHPVGWDAFGLPAEGAAIKRGVAPDKWTYNNIAVSSSTLKKMGLLYDWDREVITCREDYYKWTQWIFIKLYENGLAYRKRSYVNWCPSCQTVLANEQVEQNRCWRCGSEITKKELEQWYFKITSYAQRLLDGLELLKGWPENIKTMQKNWIGRSDGVTIEFRIKNTDKSIKVFTTRPDTIFGVTFLAVAPENEILKELEFDSQKKEEIERYIEQSIKKSEIERSSTEKEKDGVYTGYKCINPLNNREVKLFVCDYVLSGYGTGAVMGVPAHDQRDFEFAKKYGIEIVQVIRPKDSTWDFSNGAFVDEGITINSGEFSDMDSSVMKEKVTDFIEEKGFGKRSVNYRLRDWLISRQRYWGAPIPMIHCKNCGIVPVPEKDLPVLLPDSSEVDFTPKGESPLGSHKGFMNVKCPKCGNNALRDPDTMDTFVDSSWYQLRYADPKNDKKIFEKELVDKFLPVDMYIGGAEHANGHLIYFRFITKVLKDLGYLSFEEPALALFNQGMIMDKNGKVMSKSAGNAVPVGPFVDKYGSDLARGTELFIGPAGKDALWSEDGITGISRFLDRFDKFASKYNKILIKEYVPKNEIEKKVYVKLNRTIKQVGEDIENFNHNTAIASLMELLNLLYKEEQNLSFEFLNFVIYKYTQIISPFIPHLSEEIYQGFNEKDSIFLTQWPEFDKNNLEDEKITVVIQINGKVRERIEIEKDSTSDEVLKEALSNPAVQKYLQDGHLEKHFYVPNRLINLIVKK